MSSPSDKGVGSTAGSIQKKRLLSLEQCEIFRPVLKAAIKDLMDNAIDAAVDQALRQIIRSPPEDTIPAMARQPFVDDESSYSDKRNKAKARPKETHSIKSIKKTSNAVSEGSYVQDKLSRPNNIRGQRKTGSNTKSISSRMPSTAIRTGRVTKSNANPTKIRLQRPVPPKTFSGRITAREMLNRTAI